MENEKTKPLIVKGFKGKLFYIFLHPFRLGNGGMRKN
jgi:hypothetical protein